MLIRDQNSFVTIPISEKVYEKMDRKSSFCDEELAKDWMTCFYMKAGVRYY